MWTLAYIDDSTHCLADVEAELALITARTGFKIQLEFVTSLNDSGLSWDRSDALSLDALGRYTQPDDGVATRPGPLPGQHISRSQFEQLAKRRDLIFLLDVSFFGPPHDDTYGVSLALFLC